MMRFFVAALVATSACLLTAIDAKAQFTYVGPSGGDFFDAFNWQDGGGMNPVSIIDGGTGRIELDLIISSSSVVANNAAGVPYGTGSLLLNSGAVLDVIDGELNLDAGSSLTMVSSTLNITDGTAGQLDADPGSLVDLLDSFVTASDDILFEGTSWIRGSTVESTGDDIEWKDSGNLLGIENSTFKVISGLVGAQIISIEVPATITNSNFSGGRIGFETGANTTATNTVFDFSGDIEDVFNAVSFAEVTLAGTSTLRGDQLEEGLTLILQDFAAVSFIDDDAEGEWITNPDPITGGFTRVIFESLDASLTFGGNQNTTDGLKDDDQVFVRLLNGNLLSYVDAPQLFSPSDWDGESNVTLRVISLIPEPTSGLMSTFALGIVLLRRRKRACLR